MSVAVVVPFRGGCPYREAAWEHLQGLYAERHPGWQVVEAAAEGPWCKGVAVSSGVEASAAEIVVQADADVWCDDLRAAVAAVEAGAPWALPHTPVYRLDEDGTNAFLAGADWNGQPLAQRPYKGVECDGIVVAARETLLAVPIDSRFVSWGQEDECHGIALRTLVGAPWRGKAPLIHLFHPPQERLTRRRGSHESWELRKRYFAAAKDPSALRALIEESRVDRATDQPPVQNHSTVTG